MKLAVFSDLHGGKEEPIRSALEKYDYVVFLGDGLMKIRHFEYEYPEKFLFVRGNCDGYDETPLRRIIDFDGVRVMLTHGHEERVKYGLMTILGVAKREEINIVLFGHTHRPEVTEIDGILFVNPGSASATYGLAGSFAEVPIDKGKYSAEIQKLSEYC